MINIVCVILFIKEFMMARRPFYQLKGERKLNHNVVLEFSLCDERRFHVFLDCSDTSVQEGDEM